MIDSVAALIRKENLTEKDRDNFVARQVDCHANFDHILMVLKAVWIASFAETDSRILRLCCAFDQSGELS